MVAIIREVILENFMSYTYARIPFAPGINLITGPNGSGKSTILLGIAVALGQTYTERGRRLSDLIRRGEKFARVTVVLDNRPLRKRRPLPWFRSDEVFFSRYIRLDGQYWHEVNGRAVPKVEVYRYLTKIGLNPDNMLVIMHQNMVEEFVYLSPQEKLRMIEDAVGLRSYRERILSSMRRLEHTKEEEEKVKSLLSRAEEAFQYWSDVYKRYVRKRELQEKLASLQREKAWLQVIERERELRKIRDQLREVEEELETVLKNVEESRDVMGKLREKVDLVESDILNGRVTIERGLPLLRRVWEGMLDVGSTLKVMEFKASLLGERISSLRGDERKLLRRIRELASRARAFGERVETDRSITEVEEEIRGVELSIAALGEIPPNVEEAYSQYKSALEDIRSRAEEVAENRRRALEELQRRVDLWRQKLRSVISSIDEVFSGFMERLGAIGRVRVVNIEDVEEAGLEILAGFAGADPIPLNPYTHSGGERTTASMCFFLSLQKHIKSPVRAVDEFDVHMDPRNREAILEIIFEMAHENPGTQYIVITPGPLTNVPEDANIILVQKVSGASLTSVMEEAGVET